MQVLSKYSRIWRHLFYILCHGLPVSGRGANFRFSVYVLRCCESSHTVSIIDADVLTLKNNKTVVSRSASKSDADSKSFTDARRDH